MKNKQLNWNSIGDYGKRLGVSWARAQQLAHRLPPMYVLAYASGRIAMIREDAPDIRKRSGRPNKGKNVK